MRKWLTVTKIAELLNKHKTSILRRAKREQWRKRIFLCSGGKQYRYCLMNLPEDIQIAYIDNLKSQHHPVRSRIPRPGKKVRIDRYTSHSKSDREVKKLDNIPQYYIQIGAYRRKLIEYWTRSGVSVEEFIKAYQTDKRFDEIKANLDKYGKIKTPGTFYRWLRDYETHGLAGLCPQYSSRGGNGTSLDDECKELSKMLYLDFRKPSVKSVTRDLEQYGYKMNYHLVYRFLKDIPESVKTFYRYGEKAYHDKFDPYIPRDYTRFRSMEWGVADHHMMDLVVIHEGKLIRPWLTRFDDIRSRYITGWWIDVIPNTLTILRALDMTLTNCGAFENLLIDNGKDFKSNWLSGNEWKMKRYKNMTKEIEPLVEGVFHDCGFNVHFCNPYRGQSKPIERAFRTDIELFEKRIETYVGSNTVTRPEEAKLYWSRIGNQDKKQVYITLEELREKYAEYVEWFNSSWNHSGQGMDGNTPKQVFQANWTIRREIPEEFRKYILARPEKRIVQRNGVTIDGLSYYAPEMVQYIGSEVQVRRGLDDVSKVWIFSYPKPVYLFEAYCDELNDTGITEENVRKQRKLQKEARKHLKTLDKRKAEFIRRNRKSPAELLAESGKKDEPLTGPENQELQVVNGNIVVPGNGSRNNSDNQPRIIEYPGRTRKSKSKKPKLIGILDAED